VITVFTHTSPGVQLSRKNDEGASVHSHTESVIGPKESRETGKRYEFADTLHEFSGY
jgi:hypothetical protein